ncbi:hypothetical protein JCM8208_004961 [Rhodotorula glutinis]
MLSLVVKIINLVLLAIFAFTLGSSLSTLSFLTLLQGSIASLLSALSCWVALVAAVWSALVGFMPSTQWRGLPWLVLGAAVSCAAFWLWNSASGNAQAVCSSISFLADLCGSALTRWVFMGLFIVSVVLQLLVWRYTANQLGGGDGTKLMSLGAARGASRSARGGGGGGSGSGTLAQRWRAWRRKGGAEQGGDSDEEHELGGGRTGRGASSESPESESSFSPKGSNLPHLPEGGHQPRVVPTGNIDPAAFGPSSFTEPTPPTTHAKSPLSQEQHVPQHDDADGGNGGLGHAAPHTFMHLSHGTKEEEDEVERLRRVMAEGD